jgi:hypothetical protein
MNFSLVEYVAFTIFPPFNGNPSKNYITMKSVIGKEKNLDNFSS